MRVQKADRFKYWTADMPSADDPLTRPHPSSQQVPHALVDAAVARQRDVLIITAREGRTDRIIYANPAIARHTGYTPDEVIGQSPRLFQGPETSRETRAAIRAAVDACQPIQVELLNYRKDGATYWTEVDISPIFDAAGRATHMVSVQRDITERKAAQEELRRREQRFMLALEASASATWDWNLLTDALVFRDELAEHSWHGRHHGMIMGQGLDGIAALIHPEDRDRVQRVLGTALACKDTFLVQDYRLRRPDGSHAHVSDRQFVLRAEDGAPVRVIGSILDVSEKRAFEERRQQSHRLELLGEMTGGIAHNFNNLLTVILGNVNRLRDDEMKPDAVLDAIRMIDEAAQRGAALTERLVSFSQSRKISLKSVDLRGLIDAMVPVWRNLLPAGIHFEVRHAPDLWPVSTDQAHLEAAILNLVLNARDAMPDGGDLAIETANIAAGSAQLRARDGGAEERYVMIKVTDTGIGMPPADVKAAFDPFFTTKPPGKGTGLGLSSAYGFMKQSGGFVRLESTEGQGTTLRIFLRVAEDAPVAEAQSRPQHLVSDHGHRVLVVDDDALVREYVWALLTSLNYRVTTAANGEDALALLATDQQVDLLFTDLLMEGGVNGWQLAERARTLRPDLPILFTSAYPESVAAPAQGALKDINLLRKPYRPRDLSIAVSAAVESGLASPSGP